MKVSKFHLISHFKSHAFQNEEKKQEEKQSFIFFELDLSSRLTWEWK